MKRLFVGLRFSGIITHGLKDLQGGMNGANWVTVDNLHLTLRFIGECDNSLVNDILLELTKLRSNCFNIQLNGVNHFKNKGRVKSLWVGVVENSNLVNLRIEIDSLLQKINIEPERKAFKPHVTLAKLKDIRLSDLAYFEQINNLYRSDQILIRHITIFQSMSVKGRSKYFPIVDIPLRPPQKRINTV